MTLPSDSRFRTTPQNPQRADRIYYSAPPTIRQISSLRSRADRLRELLRRSRHGLRDGIRMRHSCTHHEDSAATVSRRFCHARMSWYPGSVRFAPKAPRLPQQHGDTPTLRVLQPAPRRTPNLVASCAEVRPGDGSSTPGALRAPMD
jgi:hypothetical protein